MSENKIKLVKELSSTRKNVSWFWYIFWLLVCAPVLIIVLWYDWTQIKTEYELGILYEDGTKTKITATEEQKKQLEFEAACGDSMKGDAWN